MDREGRGTGIVYTAWTPPPRHVHIDFHPYILVFIFLNESFEKSPLTVIKIKIVKKTKCFQSFIFD